MSRTLQTSRAERFVASELTEHLALVDWVRREGERRYPALNWLFHVPLGEKRDGATGAKLQAMLVRPGVPDFLLLSPRHTPPTAHGLALELKSLRGSVTSPQRAWHAFLQSQGYCVRVVRGFEAARDVLVWYVTEGA